MNSLIINKPLPDHQPGVENQSVPLVSVIVPTYNHAHYIMSAIESAFNQDFTSHEIIVIDDGSTDNTKDVLAKYGEFIRYIWQENQGLSAARNTGIRTSSGKYIALLDADDVWHKDYLSNMVPVIEADPSIGAVYSGWGYINSDGDCLPRSVIHSIDPDQFFNQLTFSNFLVPSGVIIRRDCFDEFGLFDTQLFSCEDRDMWYRISSSYKMVSVPKALVNYRVHGDNMTANLSRMEVNRRAVIEKHFGKISDNAHDQPLIRRRAFGGFYLRTAFDYASIEDYTKSQEYLKNAFKIYPELSTDLDVFYELACIGHPVGSLGLPQSVNIKSSIDLVFSLLDAVFDGSGVSVISVNYKNIAYAHAWYALGLLAYNSFLTQESRQCFYNAMKVNTRILLVQGYRAALVRSIIGRDMIDKLREYWRGMMGEA